MKIFCLIGLILLSDLFAQSQLSGIKSIPGDYPDLAAAITDLNSRGPGSGGATFNVLATQTAPTGGYLITATGTSTNPVIFQGNGNTIYASGTAGDTDGIFKLAGSDYVTINNFILTGNTSVEWGVALLKKNNTDPYDGCHYNTLTNLTITLDKANVRSVGIYGAHHTTGSTSILPDTYDIYNNANDNNTIEGNTISNVYSGICFTSIPGLWEVSIINANHVSDYGGGETPAYGIRLRNFIFSQITNNSITRGGGNLTNSYGIDASYGDGSISIENNTVSLSGNIIADTVIAINCTRGIIEFFESVSNNQVTGCDINAVAATFIGINSDILLGANEANLIEGNTISENHISGSCNIILISVQGGRHEISGNDIHNNTKIGGSGSIYCIRSLEVHIVSNNQVYSNSISYDSGTDSSNIYGIYAISSGIIEDNNVYNLSITGNPAAAVSKLYGIYVLNGQNIIRNKVHNLLIAEASASSVSNLCGIYALHADTIQVNQIYNLRFSNTPNGSVTINGIYCGTGLLVRNCISDLDATDGSESLVYGVQLMSGIMINNLIGNLYARAANGDNAVSGININGDLTSRSHLIYNTVVLGGASTGNSFGSSAISISTIPKVYLESNILINNSTPGLDGRAVAYRRSSVLLITYDSSSGSNLYYAGNPGLRNLIFYDGTNADETLSAFKSRVLPRDRRSVTENTAFLSTEFGSYQPFLHVNPAIYSRAESGGKPVTGSSYGIYTIDYDLQPRPGNPRYHGYETAPDIGADEFNGFNPGLTDVGISSLAVSTISCFGPMQEQIGVIVTNYGVNGINFREKPLTITTLVTGASTETFTGVVNYDIYLEAGDSIYWNMGLLDMNNPGTYIFNSYTTLSGDVNHVNDTMPQATRFQSSFADLPDSIDFVGYNGNNLATLFPGWHEATGIIVPFDSASLWNTESGFGHPGNTSAKINLYSTGNHEWIVGPKFLGTDSAELKFDIAITAKDNSSAPAVMGSDDSIAIMISEDCGRYWYPIRVFSVSDSLGPHLTTKTISLGAYRLQRLVAIKASDGIIDDIEDYDVHIDNIVLKSPIGDIGILALASPAVGCHSNQENVILALKNYSNVPVRLDGVFMSIRIEVTGPVTATYTGRLDYRQIEPGEILNFTMYPRLNMSLPGVYRFKAYINLPGDTDTTNNLLETVRIVYPVMSLPLSVDFSGYNGINIGAISPGWTEGSGIARPEDTASAWISNVGLDSTGNVSAKLQLSGNTTHEWIVSPYVIPAPALELKLKVALTEHGSLINSAIMGADDKVSVMVSVDCGASWTSIKDFTAADALTPALTEFTIYTPSYSGQKMLIALFATDGQVDDPNDYDFHVDDIRLQTVPFALPIELLSFSGQRTGNSNLLKWATANEQGVRGFSVERSTNAVHFDPIAFINSKSVDGNSVVRLDYQYIDVGITGDKQYYRLNEYDIDGKGHLSNTILIRNNNAAVLDLAGLYPNPVTATLLVEIHTPYSDAIKLSVMNSAGQIVKEKTAAVEKGINTIDLDTRNLLPGIYVLRITSHAHGEAISGKFLKQ